MPMGSTTGDWELSDSHPVVSTKYMHGIYTEAFAFGKITPFSMDFLWGFGGKLFA